MKRTKKSRIIDERTSGRDDHGTPKWFIDLISRYRRIGLDPAGGHRLSPASKAARSCYRLRDGTNGLKDVWRGHGLVFCNPPYGRQVSEWVKAAIRHFVIFSLTGHDRAVSNNDELIMLVAARVDTRWFKLLWAHSTAVVFCNKRFQFVGEKDPAKFPQAVVYYGDNPARFAAHFGHLGLVIYGERPRTWKQVYTRRVTLQAVPNTAALLLAAVPPTSARSSAVRSSTRSFSTKKRTSSKSSRRRRPIVRRF